MNNKMIARAMIAVMLAASVPAIAQDRGYRDDRAPERYQDRRDYREEAREERREEARDARREVRREERRAYRDERREARRDYREARDDRRAMRGAGPRHDLYRGQRLPSHYHNRQYVVDNWRAHHLSAPPRGQHWVQVGNDYVLAAIATGLIATVLLGN